MSPPASALGGNRPPGRVALGDSRPGSRLAFAIAFPLVVCALTVLVCVLVARQLLVLGIPGEWVWQYHRTPGEGLVVELMVPLGFFLAFLIAVWYLAHSSEETLSGWWREALAVALLVLLVLLFQVAAGSIWGGLGQDVLAIYQPSVGGYFGLSEEVVSLRGFLADFPQMLATREPVGHLNTHPPGNSVYFYLLRRFFERFPALAEWAALLQPSSVEYFFEDLAGRGGVKLGQAREAALFVGAILCRVVAALIVVPLYLLGRWSLGKRRAVWSAALGVAIPAALVFLPSFDAVYPTAGAAVAALMVGSLVWRSRKLAVVAGVVLYSAMVFTPVMGVVVFLVVLWYGLARLTRWGSRLVRKQSEASLFTVLLLGVVGFIVPLVAAWLVLRFNAPSTWWACMASNARFNRVTGRSYLPWVLYNPVDFLMFLGVGLSALLVVAAVVLLWRLRQWRGWGPVELGLAAYVVVLVLLNVSGANAGEAARLWMFLMPGAALLAPGRRSPKATSPEGQFAGCGRRPYSGLVLAVVLVCQAVQACVFKLYLNVLFMT